MLDYVYTFAQKGSFHPLMGDPHNRSPEPVEKTHTLVKMTAESGGLTHSELSSERKRFFFCCCLSATQYEKYQDQDERR